MDPSIAGLLRTSRYAVQRAARSSGAKRLRRTTGRPGALCDRIEGVRRRGVSRFNSADPLRISRVVRSSVKSRNPSLRIARRAMNRRRSARACDPIATTSRDWIPKQVRGMRAPIATSSHCFLRASRGSIARLRAVRSVERPPSAALHQRSGVARSRVRVRLTLDIEPRSSHGRVAAEPFEGCETARLSGRGSSAWRA